MEAILFDWDGTLVDSLDTFYRANAVVMASYGIPFDRAAYRRHYAPDWRLLYRRLGIPADRLDEAHERWRSQFSSDGARMFDGAVTSLRRLAAAGYRLGLVTATVHANAEPLLGAFGVAGLFETAVYGDDLAVHKPDPAPLRLALARLGLADRPAEAVYVGDTPDDMRMARAVGVRAIGIVSMLSIPDELRRAGADEIHASTADWVAGLLGAAAPGRMD